MKETKRKSICCAALTCLLASTTQGANYEVGIIGLGQTGYLAQGDTPLLATPFFNITLGNWSIDPASINYKHSLSLKRHVSGKLSYGLPLANNADQEKSAYILAEVGITEISPIGNFSLAYVTDVKNTEYGYRIRTGYERGHVISRTDSMYTYSFSATYIPENTANYEYGIEKKNKYNLPVRQLNGASLTYSADLTFIKQLTPSRFVLIGSNIEFFTGSMTTSKLVENNWNSTITVGYGARF